MIEVSVQRLGLKIEALPNSLRRKMRRLISDRLADYAYKTMKKKAPKRTGKLRRSIRKVRRGFEAYIFPTVPYAMFLEYGTRPHLIRPVRAQALRFETKFGEIVFTRLVRHPGTKPRPFIRETAEDVRRRIPIFWREVWSEGVE